MTNEIRMMTFKATGCIVERYFNGREVVLLGDNQPLRDVLKSEHGITTTVIATRVKENVQKGQILLDDFTGKSERFYICVPYLKSEQSVKNKLTSMGYVEFRDFCFSQHDPIVLQPGFGDYHDEYGNHLHANGVKVILDPYASNSYVYVDDSASMGAGCTIRIYSHGGEIRIEKGCQIGAENHFVLRAEGKIKIGSHTITATDCRYYTTTARGTINIGKDCMLSSEIRLLAGDSHAIFDVNTGERTLDPRKPSCKNVIEIQDHVWIGMRAFLLYNTVVGRSSIVGASATVKGRFPNNCALGGNPAKIIRRDVTWHRDASEFDMEKCGAENIQRTKEVEEDSRSEQKPHE